MPGMLTFATGGMQKDLVAIDYLADRLRVRVRRAQNREFKAIEARGRCGAMRAGYCVEKLCKWFVVRENVAIKVGGGEGKAWWGASPLWALSKSMGLARESSDAFYC